MEVLIITKHIVKPSSPTPQKFKTHKLSSIDQSMPSMYIPLIFFYENDRPTPHEEIGRRLKQSLSEILTVFYPLGGKVIQNSFIDCDDSGVEMVEARAQARLSQFTQNPKMEELQHLLPTQSYSHNENLILFVKVTFFDCGGISVGACLSHKVADSASFVMFMNAWAATCRRESSRIIRPRFDLAVHFPPIDAMSTFNSAREKEKITTKRFVFNIEKIEKLRKEASSSSDGAKNPTKVEIVSSFLWQNFIKANSSKSPPSARETPSPSPFIGSHAVNLRPRAVPPFPENTFGSCVGFGFASEEDESANLGTIVSKLKASIEKVDNDYINSVIKDDKYPQTLAQNLGSFIKSKCCPFSSWRFPVYDVDFGWGKPVWVCCGSMHFNLVILMDTPSRDGIEAWVNLPQDNDFFQILQANYDKILD